jgi:uncharacterized repeat protein (TIGR01451 family)
MRELQSSAPTPSRFGRIVVATVIGLLLMLTIVMAQSLHLSTMTGPEYAKQNDVITYTIVAVNTGSALASNTVLSDVLPSGTHFITDSCSYDHDGSLQLPCGPLNEIWKLDLLPGARVTTTLAATVTAATTGTLHVPLVNRAYISWDTGQQELVFTTTLLSAIPEFTLFHEPEPPDARTGDVITYTIVAVNTGDSVSDVVLSDTLPGGVAFVPGSCTYHVAPPGSLSLHLPCNDLIPGQNQLVWQEDMSHGTRITTTFLVTITVPAGSAHWPLQNCAHLSWSVIQEESCATSLANPTFHIYLPLIMRFREDLYEPNNTFADAYGPLESARPYRAYIWDATDEDDYYYTSPLTGTPSTLWARLFVPLGYDYDLYVYYYDPVDCAPYGGYCEVARSVQPGNAVERIRFTPVAEREYYIRVNSDIPQGGYSDLALYRLVVIYQ